MRQWIAEYARAIGHRAWGFFGGTAATLLWWVSGYLKSGWWFGIAVGLMVTQAWAWNDLRRERDELRTSSSPIDQRNPVDAALETLIDEAIQLERDIVAGDPVYEALDEAKAWERSATRKLRAILPAYRERFQHREQRDSLPSIRDCNVTQQRVAEYVLRTGCHSLRDIQKELRHEAWSPRETREREREHLLAYGALLFEIADRMVSIHDSPSASAEPHMTRGEIDGLEVWNSRNQEFLRRAQPIWRVPDRATWSEDDDRAAREAISDRLGDVEAAQ